MNIDYVINNSDDEKNIVFSFDNTKLENIMREVLDEVNLAVKEGNSPFAAFLVDRNGNIIYKAHNTVNSDMDPTLHAEISLIRKACKALNTKNLSEYILFSNAWSCSMCMSAAIKANISNYVFGAESESGMNPNITIYDIAKKTNRKLNIVDGILKEECRLQIENARNKK